MRSSVALVLMHDGQILMIKRKDDVPSFPGYASFPGGLIDQQDEQAPGFTHPQIHGAPSSHLNALRREMIEELQFDLAQHEFFRFGLLGEATTPSFNPYRFKTYFYFAECVNQPDFIFDEREIESGQWQSPRAFLERFHSGKMLAVPVTISVLKSLNDSSYWRRPVVTDFNLQWDAELECPMIEPISGVKVFMPLSNTLPPATRTNCFLIGENLLIDPSPRDELEYQRLLNALSAYSIATIMLTHHHPDHYEQSSTLARMLGARMVMSEDTHQRITSIEGLDYFEAIPVDFLKEGDQLGQWQQSTLEVFELPGHDQGQLGLSPTGREWFLAGDLIQTVGTVVIKAPEGDMDQYFASLKKVIALKPQVVFPSHGIGMGGTYKLEETLSHRQKRHQQVRQLLERGLEAQEMVEVIYEGLEPKLKPLALKTVESHLRSLNKDSKTL